MVEARRGLHPYFQTNEFTLDEPMFPLTRLSDIQESDVDLSTSLTTRIPLKLPILSSPMDTVTDHRMGILMARMGGIGVIHYNYPTIEDQMGEVRRVRRDEHGFIKDPLILSQNDTVAHARQVALENGFSSFPITENGNRDTKLVGLVTGDDLEGVDPLASLSEVMVRREDLVVARKEDTLDIGDLKAANKTLRQRKRKILPIIDEEDRVAALVTRKDIGKNNLYPHATKDDNKQLKVMVAVESRLVAAVNRIDAAAAAGVAGIIVDSRNVFAEHLKIAEYAKTHYPDLDVVLGNLVTREIALEVLERAGKYVDALRVGIGTGEVCTTSEDVGPGRPMGQALIEVAGVTREYAKKHHFVGVIADGGIKSARHIAVALALGADCVMMGSVLGALEESPAPFDPRTRTKKIRGMGSAAVISERAGAFRYNVVGTDLARRHPEGIEKSIAFAGKGEDYLNDLSNAVKNNFVAGGHRNIFELREHAWLTPAVRAASKGSL